MKQTTILKMSILLVLAAAANAQPDEGKTCSDATLKGSYGGAISGTRPAPSVIPGLAAFLQGQPEQAIGLILWVFDGKGFTMFYLAVRMKVASVPIGAGCANAYECIRYTLAFTSTGSGTGLLTNISFGVTGSTGIVDYQSAAVGSYTDTVTLTVSP